MIKALFALVLSYLNYKYFGDLTTILEATEQQKPCLVLESILGGFTNNQGDLLQNTVNTTKCNMDTYNVFSRCPDDIFRTSTILEQIAHSKFANIPQTDRIEFLIENPINVTTDVHA